MAETICVDPEQVHRIWPKVSHWIEEAYRSNSSDEKFEETEKDVLADRALLWIAVLEGIPVAAAVSKIWTYHSKKICSVLAVGGSGRNWPALLRPIEIYAAKESCFSVRLEGRRGWARIFVDYEQPWIVLEKRL